MVPGNFLLLLRGTLKLDPVWLKRRAFHLLGIALAAGPALCGCATQKMSGEQLQRVAKDWSLSIRASQVIPVYPLTEDLQPGDVFLVQTPIDEQIKVYLGQGFLPLENLVTRLPCSGYEAFYQAWPEVNDKTGVPPRLWQFPKDATGVTAAPNFANAPLAAFPSYGFSVSRSEGLNVAIPVQGVPIGLNLLDSASANGTITLKEAYTYALPGKVMYDAVQDWSAKNRAYLMQFAPKAAAEKAKTRTYSYLRVVNRVYLVKSVNVSLFSTQGTAGSASAAVPKVVDLLNSSNAKDAATTLDSLNESISKANQPSGTAAASPVPSAPTDSGAAPAVGGTVKVAMASSRAVSLVETFARPLVIGYLGFDYRIKEDGSLDVPVATFATLEGRAQEQGTAIKYEGCDEACKKIRDWRDKDPAKNTEALRGWLRQQGIDKRPYEVIEDPSAADLRRHIVDELVPKT
jgi:hypothetical protein